MEEIIKEIVEADKQARHSVEQKKQERYNIQNLIQEQSEQILQRYKEQTQQCISEKRAELDYELEKQLLVEQHAYEEALTGLEKKYADQKQQWIKEIVERCLNI